MSIKAIVFDKDGTLVDYPSYWYPVAMRATARAYELLGISPDAIPERELEDHLRELGTTESGVDINGALPRGDYAGIIAVLARRAEALGATFTAEESVDAFSRGYSEKETKACGRVVPTTPLLDKTLRKLKERGILLALITSDDELGARVCLDALGIIDLFDKIIGYDAAVPAKPAPDHMLRFLDKHGLDKSEVLMVGDTFTDIAFAKNSGVLSVGVGKDKRSRDLLISVGADHVLCDVSELFSIHGLFD
jgi:phosphoglycolate phosphatase-like HAD superfamily hydrolase